MHKINQVIVKVKWRKRESSNLIIKRADLVKMQQKKVNDLDVHKKNAWVSLSEICLIWETFAVKDFPQKLDASRHLITSYAS